MQGLAGKDSAGDREAPFGRSSPGWRAAGLKADACRACPGFPRTFCTVALEKGVHPCPVIRPLNRTRSYEKNWFGCSWSLCSYHPGRCGGPFALDDASNAASFRLASTGTSSTRLVYRCLRSGKLPKVVIGNLRLQTRPLFRCCALVLVIPNRCSGIKSCARSNFGARDSRRI
jgi:hypothetical protein